MWYYLSAQCKVREGNILTQRVFFPAFQSLIEITFQVGPGLFALQRFSHFSPAFVTMQIKLHT